MSNIERIRSLTIDHLTFRECVEFINYECFNKKPHQQLSVEIEKYGYYWF